MQVAWQRKELLIKVVYYGPPRSGKTTNLRQLQAQIPPQYRSDLISLDTHGDRTLFFDLMQVTLGRIRGLVPRVSLYTVPGQPRYQRVREVVLRGADGIVFVADSDRQRLEENRAMWQQMLLQLRRLHLEDIPIVIQLNKQDLPHCLTPQEIQRALVPPQDRTVPLVKAQAFRNIGVREAFMLVLNLILQGVK